MAEISCNQTRTHLHPITHFLVALNIKLEIFGNRALLDSAGQPTEAKYFVSVCFSNVEAFDLNV
jgi:hypothetical protein